MTAHRHALAALALTAVVVTALLPSAAAASKADAFEGKIQPVSGQLYRKAGRFELTLGIDRSLNDAFFVKTFADVKLGYHFTESLSLSLHGATGAASPTSSTTVCPTGEGCRSASEVELRQVPGRIRQIFGAEVAWAPIYGKLNAFSEAVVHIDLALLGGLDIIRHDEVLSAANATQSPAVQSASLPIGPIGLPFTDASIGQVELPFSAHLGIGARVFFTGPFGYHYAVRLDLKDYIYGVKVPSGDPPNGWDLQNQLFAELGVSFFFPTSNRRQP